MPGDVPSAAGAPARRYDRRLGALRVVAVYAVLAAVLAWSEPRAPYVWIGLAATGAGEAIRLWAAGHLYKTTELVTSGPYRFVRNPLYVGRFLIFTGLCTMALLPRATGVAVLLGGWLVFFGYYLPRKERVEPTRLRAAHGARYERYFDAVPAFVPSVRPFPDAGGARWSVARMRRNREHWMVAGLAAAIAYLLWRAYG